jgi:arginyl-tRNA synthetase
VQYAHARIASIVRHAAERGVERRPLEEVDLSRLEHESELDVLRTIAEWPQEVQTAARQRAPYRLTHFAERLAAEFHRFYAECRVVSDDAGLTQARLWLCAATRQTVANALVVLGVSAPEEMERLDEAEELSR